jgi:hypothetical protein
VGGYPVMYFLGLFIGLFFGALIHALYVELSTENEYIEPPYDWNQADRDLWDL